MGKRYVRPIPAAILFLLLTSLSGCLHPDSYYQTGSSEKNRQLDQLFEHLKNAEDYPESRFVVIQQIVKLLHSADEIEKCNFFLTTYVEKHPDDPFNGYYLFIVAQNYMRDEAYPFAVHYFERILRNHPDLLVQDNSIHLNCLKNLLKLTNTPELKVTYYKELLSRFRRDINLGLTYYYLGKTYEELGEWDLAIQAYGNYLKYPETTVPGIPNAQQEIQNLVKLYTYKNTYWTMDSLEDLVNRIKTAIHRGNENALRNLMSQIDFFTTSWEEKETHDEEAFMYQLSTFLNPRVRYSPELDRDSNAQEAYLRTSGWSYRIKTWYLYFKRIHFPPDPDRHGQWEWAGIYFGDKPFVGSNDSF
jgi:tetratricopeptide (TPR) repeat protein